MSIDPRDVQFPFHLGQLVRINKASGGISMRDSIWWEGLDRNDGKIGVVHQIDTHDQTLRVYIDDHDRNLWYRADCLTAVQEDSIHAFESAAKRKGAIERTLNRISSPNVNIPHANIEFVKGVCIRENNEISLAVIVCSVRNDVTRALAWYGTLEEFKNESVCVVPTSYVSPIVVEYMTKVVTKMHENISARAPKKRDLDEVRAELEEIDKRVAALRRRICE